VQCNCYDMHLRRYHPHWESVSKISPSTSSIAIGLGRGFSNLLTHMGRTCVTENEGWA
jgi:hypothetical protein